MKRELAILATAWWTGCATAQTPGTTVAELSQMLATGRFETAFHAGKLVKCEVTHSTGDAELDRAFCEMVRECAAENPPRAGVHGDACMDRKQAEVFARIVAERRGTRTQQ